MLNIWARNANTGFEMQLFGPSVSRLYVHRSTTAAHVALHKRPLRTHDEPYMAVSALTHDVRCWQPPIGESNHSLLLAERTRLATVL